MLYTDRCLKEIVFPLGGIGTGSVGVNGIGHLVDWEIFNRPNKGSYNGYTHLAIRAVFPDGTSDTRILQGDWTRDLMGQYGKERFRGYGFGPNVNTLAGLPHFRRVVFSDAFPFAALTFSDETFPAEIELTVFNPFLPHNVADSALPAALFEVTVRSRRPDVTYTVCFTLENPFDRSRNTEVGLGTGKAVFSGTWGTSRTLPTTGI